VTEFRNESNLKSEQMQKTMQFSLLSSLRWQWMGKHPISQHFVWGVAWNQLVSGGGAVAQGFCQAGCPHAT
jgi:hypothetical protein